MKRIAIAVGLLMVASALGVLVAPAAATEDAQDVLIYGPSMGQVVSPDWTYNEETIASDLGHNVTVVDPQTWVGMTEAEFAAFDAIVFGDPKCGVSTQMLEPANYTKATWSPVITGPTIVIGTTPQLYQFAPNTQDRELIENGISHALNGTGTGLYVSLACYYAQAAPNTAVDFLSQVGDFQVAGREGCTGEVNITSPDHPAMAGLTSIGQPAASCATQELLSAFPDSLEVLATAVRPSDGAHLPFIVATTPVVTSSNPPADPPVDPPTDPPADPPYDESYTPFADFSAEIEWDDDDEIEVEGTFTLGEESDGIDLSDEDVTVTVGEYSFTIQAGSFEIDDEWEFEFEGVIDGVDVEVEIEREKDNTFEFEIEFEGVSMDEGDDPIQVELVIGNDHGSTEASSEHEDDEEDEKEKKRKKCKHKKWKKYKKCKHKKWKDWKDWKEWKHWKKWWKHHDDDDGDVHERNLEILIG